MPCWLENAASLRARPAWLFCILDSGSLSIRGTWTRRPAGTAGALSKAVSASPGLPVWAGPGRCTQMRDPGPLGSGAGRGPAGAHRYGTGGWGAPGGRDWAEPGRCTQIGDLVLLGGGAGRGWAGVYRCGKGGFWGVGWGGARQVHTDVGRWGGPGGRDWAGLGQDWERLL